MSILPRRTIRELHEASISAGLAQDRDGLLSGIERELLATLPTTATPNSQLLSDLSELNKSHHIDGSLPLAIWLSNAILLVGPIKQAEVFKGALAHCEGALDSESQPPLASMAALDKQGTQSSMPVTSPRINVRVVASFSVTGAAAGITLEITRASTLFLILGIVLFVVALFVWAVHSTFGDSGARGLREVVAAIRRIYSSPHPSAAPAKAISSGAVTAASYSGILTTVLISLIAGVGADLTTAQFVATLQNRMPGWQVALGIQDPSALGVPRPPAGDGAAPTSPASPPRTAAVGGSAPEDSNAGAIAQVDRQPDSVCAGAPHNNQKCADGRWVCAQLGGFCTATSQCCDRSLTCLEDKCVACFTRGTSCSGNDVCCYGEKCTDGLCGGCTLAGQPCTQTTSCCGDMRCINGTCGGCAARGAACSATEPCCGSLLCLNGSCRECYGNSINCISDTECCSGFCEPTQSSAKECKACRSPFGACRSHTECCAGACVLGKCTGQKRTDPWIAPSSSATINSGP